MQTTTKANPEKITLRRRHGQFVATVPSTSRKNLCHTIRVMEADFTATCTCEGFRFNGTCYHCQAAIEVAHTLKARKHSPAEAKAVVTEPRDIYDFDEIEVQAKETQESEAELAELTARDLEAIREFEEAQAWRSYRAEQVAQYHMKGVA